MRELFGHWLETRGPFRGGLACGVRAADGTVTSCSWVAGFSEASIENSLRCVADLFQVIQHNRIAPGRVRWVFGNALFHCERRADGTCLGIFTIRDHDGELDVEGLEQWFAEFRGVGVAKPVGV